MSKIINGRTLELRQGKMWIDGEYRFLKIGKPQLDFSSAADIEHFITELGIVRDKKFDCLELNCYWHHLDTDGDGKIDVSLEPLNKLISAIVDHGMYPCLSVETYGVGGGQIPHDFWKSFPDAVAVDSNGDRVRDDEYGYATAVPSLYDADYLRTSRSFIRNLVSSLDHAKILWYETTVEPQYIGSRWIDFSPQAKAAYEAWLTAKGIAGLAFPTSFPVAESFLTDPTWNEFRAEWLAGWVNGDAQAYRDVAGKDAWVAADYLDAEESTMIRRCGNPLAFLRALTGPNIIQVNWSWHIIERQPNLKAYQRVRKVMAETGRDWVVMEHMTINGTDYLPEEMNALLRNTLANGTRFGWEFVDILADHDDPAAPVGTVIPGAFKPIHFSVYGPDWKPKACMAVVDDNWDAWMKEVYDQSEVAGAAIGEPQLKS
jgi:hypothetical protein